MDNLKLKDLINKQSIVLTDAQLKQFDKYYELLIEWNTFMNLTAITQYNEVLVKHFADSLAIKPAIDALSKIDSDIGQVLDLEQGIHVIDVGTGAGFPGLPIKIAFEKCHVKLLDSLNKRVQFLNEVITKSGIADVEAVHSRAEDAGRDACMREQYDLGVSRAVSNLSTLSEYVLPFVKIGGYFVAYKSGEIEKEVDHSKKAIKILGGQVKHIYKFCLPDTDIERSFVFIKKIHNTPKKYPRKAGIPSKEPIDNREV